MVLAELGINRSASLVTGRRFLFSLSSQESRQKSPFTAIAKQSRTAAAQGTVLGNPRLSEAAARGTAAGKSRADQFAANMLPLVREIQKAGASSLNAIADALNKRGIRTARGKEWTHVQVGHVLRRAT